MIDDVTSDVENHFAELYRRLYNSVDDHENLQFISKEVNNKIDQSCIKDVMRITPELVQKAISHLKHKKTRSRQQLQFGLPEIWFHNT